MLDLPCAPKRYPQLRSVCLQHRNIHGANTGHLSSTVSHYRWSVAKAICSRPLEQLRLLPRDRWYKYHKRFLISLDVAEMFEPILVSVLRSDCTNSCLLSVMNAVTSHLQSDNHVTITRYNLTKTKSIALFTRQPVGKIIAFELFFYVCPH